MENADENTSNWMRYVKFTNNPEESNLETFQCDGNLYYKTTKPVEMGRELLLYRDGPSDTAGYITPKIASVFGCHFCGCAVVKEECDMESDIKKEEVEKTAQLESLFECRYCEVVVMSEKILKYHEAQCRRKYQQMQDR